MIGKDSIMAEPLGCAYGRQPAYPVKITAGLAFTVWPGMTLREYYAGLAMSGHLADGLTTYSVIAQRAVQMADELLKELSKETPSG